MRLTPSHPYAPENAVMGVRYTFKAANALRIVACALAEAGVNTRERFIRTPYDGETMWLVERNPKPPYE